MDEKYNKNDILLDIETSYLQVPLECISKTFRFIILWIKFLIIIIITIAMTIIIIITIAMTIIIITIVMTINIDYYFYMIIYYYN